MFDLTRQERTVLFSLALVFLFGISLNMVFKKNPGLRQAMAVLDNDRLYRRMDLNAVSYTELLNLPNVGPATANRIITYRQENGPFHDLDELKAIPGIGKSNFNNISKFFKVGRK